MTHFCHFFKKL